MEDWLRALSEASVVCVLPLLAIWGVYWVAANVVLR